MPNAGRLVVAVSTVLAVALGVGFVVVTTNRPDIRVDEGGSSCMASTGSGDTVFGMYVINDGDQPATLDSIDAGTVNDLSSVGYTALPARGLHDDAIGVGTESYRDVADWSKRRAVAGAPVPAHSSVQIVIFPRLARGADSGNVRDFTIRITAAGGIQHTFFSETNDGFYPASAENMPDCDR